MIPLKYSFSAGGLCHLFFLHKTKTNNYLICIVPKWSFMIKYIKYIVRNYSGQYFKFKCPSNFWHQKLRKGYINEHWSQLFKTLLFLCNSFIVDFVFFEALNLKITFVLPCCWSKLLPLSIFTTKQNIIACKEVCQRRKFRIIALFIC